MGSPVLGTDATREARYLFVVTRTPPRPDMYLSFKQFLAIALFPLVGMMACDIPVVPSGSTTVTEIPDLSSATTRTGSLTDADGTRENGAKADEIAKVTVPAGATLHVLMESEAFDTYLLVRVAGSSTPIVNDDWQGSQRRSFVSQTNTTGNALEATIFASAYGTGHRGDYTVKYLVDAPPPPPAGRALSVPGTVSGTLGSSSTEYPLLSNDATRRADAYTFTLSTGQRATVRMESAAFDTYLKVLRDGTFLARNDDFGGSRSASQVEVTGPGTFTVLAGAFSATSNTGAYSLAVTTDGAAPKGTEQPKPNTQFDGPGLPLGRSGGLYNGELTDSDREVPLTANEDLRKADVHHVQLNAGETFVVTMEGQGFDTYLKMDRDGAFVARNDDAGSTRRSEIRYTASQSGVYTVYAGTFSSAGRGRYQLSWRIE